MSSHLKTTQAVLIRKMMVGAAFFLLSASILRWIEILYHDSFAEALRWPLCSLLGVISLAATWLVQPADHAAKRVLQDYVLRRQCYAHIALTELVEELQSVLDLREIANLVVNSFAECLHLKTVAFYVARPENDDFEVVSAFGWPTSELRRCRLSMHSLLAEIIFKNGNHVLIRNSLLKSVPWQDSTNLASDFNLVRAGWIAPFVFKDEVIGFLAFGAESPEHVFEKADFEFFLRFARRVTICLKNALEVEILKNQNRELQNEHSQRFQVSKLRAISQLAEGLAHEIHNPLTIISGKAQVLLFKKGDSDWPKRVEESLAIIIQQSKRAADIIRKLLASVRESQAPPKRLDLGKVAVETAELMRSQVALKQIEVTVDADDDLTMTAHPGDMSEIFSGLILNGLERIENHGWIRIEMRRLRGEESVQISVTDSSRGFSEEAAEQIFDPFFKSRHEDLGLGMFAVKQIVHRYGGSIRAESRQDHGALFQIHLPLFRSADVPKEMQIESIDPESVFERK